MKKFRVFINFDKEEQWLSQMAAQGYELTKVSFGYTFRKAAPASEQIRIDYRNFKNQQDFVDYITLFEDSGWKHIAGTKNSGVQYFKQIGSHSSSEIFSDHLSKAGRYKQASNMWLTLAVVFFPILIANNQPLFDWSVILHPKQFYLTPGLWEMTGAKFWRAFLFETPFAIFRGYTWLFILICILTYAWFAYKSWRLYKDAMNGTDDVDI